VRNLLSRIGADDDAATLQRAMRHAGYHGGAALPSHAADGNVPPLTGPEALEFANERLRRVLESHV
jgi:hypothetical protein